MCIRLSFGPQIVFHKDTEYSCAEGEPTLDTLQWMAVEFSVLIQRKSASSFLLPAHCSNVAWPLYITGNSNVCLTVGFG